MPRPVPRCLNCNGASDYTLAVLMYNVGVPKEERVTSFESGGICTECSKFALDRAAGTVAEKALRYVVSKLADEPEAPYPTPEA